MKFSIIVMMSIEKIKNISIKNLVTSLIILILLVGTVIGCFKEVIFQLPYEEITGNNNKSAIIYIWGFRYYSQSDNFDPCGLSTSEIDEIEHQCALSELDMVREVQKKWGWDMYFYYGVQPKFKRHQYDNLLIVFSGHGKYENEQQFFTYRANKIVEVEKISKDINCNNLTVIVSSCFSFNWHHDFQHDNLTNLFTSDLCNRTTASMPYPSCSTEVDYFISFSRIFLINLYNGLDYSSANKTTFEFYYTIFPTYNCSNYSDECKI